MFNIGDNIVYPMHGAGTIESIEEKNMFGNKEEYYIIKMPVGDMKLMVPTKAADTIGVREVVGKNTVSTVFDVLEKPKQSGLEETNWNRRYKSNVEKIKSGDICELADVVRDLSHRHMERGLSTGEKKMLNTAKEILVSELILAEGANHDEIDNKIEDKIKVSFETSINAQEGTTQL